MTTANGVWRFTLLAGSLLSCLLDPSFLQAQGLLEILSQPKDLTVAIGGEANLSVEVAHPDGSPVSYQWQRYWGDLPGMTNATLTLKDLELCQAGVYRVVLSNDLGTLTSDSAILSIVGVAGWGNDYGHNCVPTGLTNVVALGAGPTYTVLLNADRALVAAGGNDQGELNMPGSLGEVVAISVGEHHSLALTPGGTVVQWGSQLFGQGSVPPGLTQVVAIAAGAVHSLALKADNSVVAWGANTYGQASVPKDLTDVVAIAAGYSHNLALKADGTVVAWGDNSYGKAAAPPGLRNVVAISAGQSHSLALKSDGTVVAWGDNLCKQIQVPPGLSNVIAVAAGGYQNLALKADGTIVGWGVVDDPWSPRMPWCLNNVVAITCAGQRNLALVGNGPPFLVSSPIGHSAPLGTFSAFRVQATGSPPLTYQWRFNGADLPGATDCVLPLENVQAAQAGLYSVVVANRYGQLTSPDVWLNVPGIAIASHPQDQTAYLNGTARLSVAAVGQGPFNYQWRFEGNPLASATDGTLLLTNLQWSQDGAYSVEVSNSFGTNLSYPAHLAVLCIAAWGYGFEGKNDIPQGLTNVVAIAEGASHTLALLADGTVRVWGKNYRGQLDVPPGLADVVAIAAGLYHSVALKADGTVVTWGNDQASGTIKSG
jgi:alpha-tubulin suppressor-like RCC1 family protein